MMPAFVQVERTVNRLMANAHRCVVGKPQRQPDRDGFWRPPLHQLADHVSPQHATGLFLRRAAPLPALVALSLGARRIVAVGGPITAQFTRDCRAVAPQAVRHVGLRFPLFAKCVELAPFGWCKMGVGHRSGFLPVLSSPKPRYQNTLRCPFFFPQSLGNHQQEKGAPLPAGPISRRSR